MKKKKRDDKAYKIDSFKYELSYGCDKAFEWRKWAKKIPYIKWPSSWLVKAVPPFSGAIIRYHITKKGLKNSRVSVYLDCYNLLGVFGYPKPKPYWEIFPDKNVNASRVYMRNTKGLLNEIKQSLKSMKKRNIKKGRRIQ